MPAMGGQTAGGLRIRLCSRLVGERGRAARLGESAPPTGSWISIVTECPISQEGRQSSVVLEKLIEEHPVEARWRGYDDVGDGGHSRDFMRAPLP
jgi:hypothetical protein